METVIWIAQSLLAAAMLLAGLGKLAQTKEQLVASGRMDWTEDFSPQQLKGIGVLEVLAAIGLIVPAALDVVPVLTAFAAAGVVLLMTGAAATHLRRGEMTNIAPAVVLGAIALFVAIERFGPHAL